MSATRDTPPPNHNPHSHLMLHRDRVPNFANMKKRSLAGGCGVGVFIICFVTIVIAFSTPRWLVSDQRITSAKLDGLGLWVHCFRSLPDVKDDFQRRFFVGCRWVYDPFTTGYDEIRGFLLPWFMIVTQFFYTLALIGALLGLVLVLLFFLCAGPDLSWYVRLIRSISWLLLATGICGSFGVIIFACFGNRNNWMPEHANNWFGESRENDLNPEHILIAFLNFRLVLRIGCGWSSDCTNIVRPLLHRAADPGEEEAPDEGISESLRDERGKISSACFGGVRDEQSRVPFA